MHEPCYWKIFLSKKTNKLIVVEMQSFDEVDYDQNKFYRDVSGEAVRFDNEAEAVAFLNKTFKAEYIDEEYLSPNNLSFFKDAKHA